MLKSFKAFTLIELLIVVAIIAILAAIAVPNFLEAQTRAKVSRVRADMRTTATALETYHIDVNTYPFQNPEARSLRLNNTSPYILENLSTPVSYLTGDGAYFDPFKGTKIYNNATLSNVAQMPTGTPNGIKIFQLYRYFARNENTAAIAGRDGDPKPKWYIMGSAGPDLHYDNLNDPMSAGVVQTDTPEARAFVYNHIIYDATNGTISRGGLYRTGGAPTGKGTAVFHVASMAQ